MDNDMDLVQVIPCEQLKNSLLVFRVKEGVTPEQASHSAERIRHILAERGINAAIVGLGCFDAVGVFSHGIKNESGEWIIDERGVPICGSRSQMLATVENALKFHAVWTIVELPK